MAASPATQFGSWGEDDLPDHLNQLAIKEEVAVSASVELESLRPSGSVPAVATTAGTPVAGDVPSSPAGPACDPAVMEALKDPRERHNVIYLEELVERYLSDTTKEVLEFPGKLSNYQRMLAHRVAQFYGLQTSTVDYEEGPGRVIGHRTKFSCVPQVRPSAMVWRQGSTGRPQAGGSHSDRAPRVLLRPSGSDDALRNGSGSDAVGVSQPQTLRERQADYHKARERIIGNGGGGGGGGNYQNGGSGPRGALPNGVGRGGSSGDNARGTQGIASSSTAGSEASSGGRGRGRKAMFRDRGRELNDPDYRRGVDRYPSAAMDPTAPPMPGGMYIVPTYQAEFPMLAGHPIPPPNNATSPNAAAGHHHALHQGSPGSGGWAGQPMHSPGGAAAAAAGSAQRRRWQPPQRCRRRRSAALCPCCCLPATAPASQRWRRRRCRWHAPWGDGRRSRPSHAVALRHGPAHGCLLPRRWRYAAAADGGGPAGSSAPGDVRAVRSGGVLPSERHAAPRRWLRVHGRAP